MDFCSNIIFAKTNPMSASGNLKTTGPSTGPSNSDRIVGPSMIQGSAKTSQERQREERIQKAIVVAKEDVKQLQKESEMEREKV